MHYKFVYENNRGQKINLSEHPYYLDVEPLLDYQWSYSQKEKRRGNIIAGFAKDIQSMDLTLNILAGETRRRDEAIDEFNNLIEADIYDGIAGKIWLNDWYTRGYIISSQNTKWQYGKPIVQKRVKLVREQENWYHSVRVGNFGNTEQEEAFNFLEDEIKTFERIEGASTNDFRALSVGINPKQAGSGDPAPDNVRPISGWDSVNVARSGKNLLDLSSLRQGDWTTIETQFNVTTDEMIPINGGQTYMWSQNATINGRYLRFYDADGNHLPDGDVRQYNALNASFVAPNNAVSMRAMWYILSGTLTPNDVVALEPQIELGSTATSYEPYQADTYTTDLPETVYGGSLDVVNGVLTVDRAMVDLGTLDWYIIQVAGHERAYSNVISDSKPSVLTEVTSAVCSQYTPMTNNQVYNHASDGIFAVDNNGRVQIYDSRYISASGADFKTAMNGVQLCYPLATPRTIQLTPKQVTTLLGTNNVWADSGDVTVEYWDDTGRLATASGSVVTFSKRNVMSGTGYDYAYDYMADIQSQQRISNPNSTPCEFVISIQGYVNRPIVQIGENVIAVDVEVPYGANLQVDSSAKTAILTLADGTMINVFGARDPDYYLFARIPSGNNIVTWNGSFMWEVKMLEERSEPRWLTD